MLNEAQNTLTQKLGYRFKEPGLLTVALTHRSTGLANNERLEFLGDALLGMIIAEALYHRFPDAREGELTRLRAMLVRRETLVVLAHELEIGQYLTLGAGERKSGGRFRDSILANAMESIIGAIYLDAGMEKCRDWVLNRYRSLLSSLSREIQKDAKTKLQELLQARRMELPSYEIVAVEGEAHQQLFTIRCRIATLNETVLAQGSSRRRAEQMAAAIMLEKLQEEQHR